VVSAIGVALGLIVGIALLCVVIVFLRRYKQPNLCATTLLIVSLAKISFMLGQFRGKI